MVETKVTQRIDVWLWHARFYKTRSISSKMVKGGKVRLNGNICKKPSSNIVVGDVLTFARADEILIAKIVAIGIRRGPAPEAQLLYEDLTPAREVTPDGLKTTEFGRSKGAGRPTKSDRRAIDKLMERG